jgi:hypothetical protein
MSIDRKDTQDISHLALRTSELLRRFAEEGDGPTVTLADIAAHLRERSFGLLLFVTGMLGWIPVLPPGVSSIFGLAISLFAVQLMVGRVRPWMPGWLARRGIGRAAFAKGLLRVTPLLARVERVSRPRLAWMTGPAAERLLGGYILILALFVCVPLPMTNAMPAFAVTVIAIALIQQDGLLSLIGIGLGIAAIAAMIAIWGGAYLGAVWAFG